MLIDKKMLKFVDFIIFLRVDFAIWRVGFCVDLDKTPKDKDRYGFFGNDFSCWGWHAHALI